VRAGYEALRHQALSGLQGAGWAVVVRGGVGAWVAACAACPPPRALPVGPLGGGARLPLGLHTEVALLLAGMVLPAGREGRQ
jgi:hypothetical protein